MEVVLVGKIRAPATAVPKPQPAGIAAPSALQALGYVHPAIGVGASVLSFASNHPLPDTMGFPEVSVYVGTGRVLITPVVVYVGNAAGSAGAELIVAGGQGNEVCITPALAPPVIQDSNPVNRGPAAAPQKPRADLGSVGIQPERRPNWYDQAGAPTTPVWSGLTCKNLLSQLSLRIRFNMDFYLPSPEEPIS